MERAPPAHATICSPSVAIVESILSLYPAGYYLIWRGELDASKWTIVMRVPGAANKWSTTAKCLLIPLCTSVEADLSAAGYPDAICAAPEPPRTIPTWTVKNLRSDSAASTSEERGSLTILSLPADVWKKIICYIRDVKTLCALRRVSVAFRNNMLRAPVVLDFRSSVRRTGIGPSENIASVFPAMRKCKPMLRVHDWKDKSPALCLRHVNAVQCTTLTRKAATHLLNVRTHLRGIAISELPTPTVMEILSKLPLLDHLELHHYAGYVSSQKELFLPSHLCLFSRLTYLRVEIDRSQKLSEFFKAFASMRYLRKLVLDLSPSSGPDVSLADISALSQLPLRSLGFEGFPTNCHPSLAALPRSTRLTACTAKTLQRLRLGLLSPTRESVRTISDVLETLSFLPLRVLALPGLYLHLESLASAFMGTQIRQIKFPNRQYYGWEQPTAMPLTVKFETGDLSPTFERKNIAVLASSQLPAYLHNIATLDYNSSLLWAVTPDRNITELLDCATQLRVVLQKLPDRRIDAAAFEKLREKAMAMLKSLPVEIQRPETLVFLDGILYCGYVVRPHPILVHLENTPFLTRIDSQRNRALAVSSLHRQDTPLFISPSVLREEGHILDLRADFSALYAPLPADELRQRKLKDLVHLIDNLGTAGLSETMRCMTPLSVDEFISALDKIRWTYLYPGLPMGMPEGDTVEYVRKLATEAELKDIRTLIGASFSRLHDYLRSRPPSCVSITGWVPTEMQ